MLQNISTSTAEHHPATPISYTCFWLYKLMANLQAQMSLWIINSHVHRSFIAGISCNPSCLPLSSAQTDAEAQGCLLPWRQRPSPAGALSVYIVVQSLLLLPLPLPLPRPAACAACPCLWDLYAPLPRLHVLSNFRQRPR